MTKKQKNKGFSENEEKKDRRSVLWSRIKPTLKKWIMFILNPRLLICFGIAWFITNGWSYLFLWLGLHLGINWMSYVAGAYLGLLWVPFTPEKILTVIIAFGILRLLFPKDEKTLAILREEFAHLKAQLAKKKEKKQSEKKKDVASAEENDSSANKME